MKVMSMTAMVAKHTPILEARDRMFDSRSPSAMSSPRTISHDPAIAKDGDHELVDAAIPTVCQDTAMMSAERFDVRASVVHRIVAVAGSTRGSRDDSKVPPTNQHLRVARPAVVLRACRPTMIPRWDQRAIDDPRFAAIRGMVFGTCVGEVWRHRGDDAMHRRLRHVEERRELAERQVRAQRSACDHDAHPARA